jgi:hypothetical protein
MAKDRRYLPPNEGGMGAINITTYAHSLRCSWYKRINSGLWSDILMAKVENKENCCFIRPKDIHPMHISILPIVKAFEALQVKFLNDGGTTARINTPLDQIALIKRPATRTRKEEWSKPTRTTHPFLFKKGKICEITGSMLTTPDSTYSNSPKLKSNPEIWEVLGISALHFLRKAEITRQLKILVSALIENKDFSKKKDPASLPLMFSKVKKGSQTYRNILIGNSGTVSAPKSKIEKDWRISEKAGRENFFEKAFSFWKNSCLPAKIQIMLLKICNHQLKLNAQLRHFATDEQGIRVKPECTFCTISDEENIEKETYKHFFLECKHSKTTLEPTARKYNIPTPNVSTKGELILYYFPWEGKWDETRLNIFYAIFKFYLLSCRRRKILPTSQHFETTLKYECRNIVMTNPTNSGLTKNLLPLWTGHELSESETLELLEEVEGKTDKGKLFNYSNKNTIVLNTQVHNNYRFPIVAGDYQQHRLNEKRNNILIKNTLLPEAAIIGHVDN